MKYSYALLAFIVLILVSCEPTPTTINIDFENLTTLNAVTTSNPSPHSVQVKDTFFVGDRITETISGTMLVVLPFQSPIRTDQHGNKLPPTWASDGFVAIVTDNKSGGTGNELWFNNACIGIILTDPQNLNDVTLRFTDYGGNINLIENYSNIHNENDFASITSPTALGLVITITPSAATQGTLQLSGTISSFTFPGPVPKTIDDKNFEYSVLIGGGQELWIDDIVISLNP